MSVYCVTGKLGNGKTLVTVGRIKDALLKGRRVATNLDINLEAMFGSKAKNIDLVRIPDKPSLFDLETIGYGYQKKKPNDYDESNFGLLVLDECGTWFNSRNWQDKGRKEVNDWFLHSRKLCWDVYIIIQDLSILDSQARDTIAELIVTCRRLDNIRLPFISAPIKMLTGYNLKLPRIHRAKVVYADGLISDVWVYRGNDLFACYDTGQIFSNSYSNGVHSILPPYYVKGRYQKPWDWSRVVRLTKIYFKRFNGVVLLSAGLLIGAFVMLTVQANSIRSHVIDYELKQHKIEYKSSSLSSSASSLHNSEPSTIVSKLSQFASSLKILGHYQVNERIIYEFSDGSPSTPENPARYFTNDDLRNMGFSVVPRSGCQVELKYESGSSLVYCF